MLEANEGIVWEMRGGCTPLGRKEGGDEGRGRRLVGGRVVKQGGGRVQRNGSEELRLGRGSGR